MCTLRTAYARLARACSLCRIQSVQGLLAAATGAIWKCASAICKTKKYLEKGLVELLVSLLESEPEEVLINIAGTIEEISKAHVSYASIVKRANGIPPLIKLLTINNQVTTSLFFFHHPVDLKYTAQYYIYL